MGTEVAVRGGAGTVVLDVRRGDGPKGCFDYTMASIATTERLIEASPDTVAAAIRAIVKTQKALKADVSLATKVGRALFPPQEAALIAALQNGTIAGAGLDVFDNEPLPPDHPFRSLDNAVLTGHTGYVMRENYVRGYSGTVEDVVAWLNDCPIRLLN